MPLHGHRLTFVSSTLLPFLFQLEDQQEKTMRPPKSVNRFRYTLEVQWEIPKGTARPPDLVLELRTRNIQARERVGVGSPLVKSSPILLPLILVHLLSSFLLSTPSIFSWPNAAALSPFCEASGKETGNCPHTSDDAPDGRRRCKKGEDHCSLSFLANTKGHLEKQLHSLPSQATGPAVPWLGKEKSPSKRVRRD